MIRPRIAVVITRGLDEQVGRVNTMRSVLAALDSFADITVLRLAHVLESPRILALGEALLRAVWAGLTGRPPSLQCVIYDNGPVRRDLARTIASGGFDAVYFDMIRCLALVEAVRRQAPTAHLVLDMDDLLSHRAELLRASGLALSLGFVRKTLPPGLARLLEGPLSKLVLAYEGAALARAERRMAGLVQAVVLVSGSERDRMALAIDPADADKVVALPPPQAVQPVPPPAPPWRFVFAGSDEQVQNRHSIDWLLDAWEALRPGAALHIFGAQRRPNRPVAGVVWRGFVADPADIYAPGSIALSPTLFGGGLKTKVIEAWARGCPVLGSPLAFGGLDIKDYPGWAPLEDWPPLLRDPDAHRALWIAAAAEGQAFVASHLSPERYAQRWRQLLTPQPAWVRTS